MYSSGQNSVAGHAVDIYNSAGTKTDSFEFTTNVGSGNNQRKILIATAKVQTIFNVAPDLLMDAASITEGGGKVCFDTVDCVSWGSYSGSSTGVGSPFNPTEGLIPGASMERRDPNGTLEASDDTDDSATDFGFGIGGATPENNAAAGGGPPRGHISFPHPGQFFVDEGETLQLQINRGGFNSQEASASLSSASHGSADPSDFVALDPDPTPVNFAASDTSESAQISIVDDDQIEGEETFLLTLRDPGPSGATLGRYPNALVTIQDNEFDETVPVSTVTRPAHGKTYEKPKVNLVRGSAGDSQTGLASVRVALRKKMRSGGCTWWNGNKFVARPCDQKLFLSTTFAEGSWQRSLGTSLPVSVGTKVKNYTAFSRARDAAGNVESFFEVARNQSTFEIKPAV